MESTFALLFLEGHLAGKAFPISEAEVVLGRSRSCHIPLVDDNVSRKHVALRRQGDEVMIEDLGSTHGTFLNDRRLRGIVSLHEGDIILVGAQKMQFTQRAAAEAKAGGLTALGGGAAPVAEPEPAARKPGEEEVEHDRTRFAGEVEALDTQYHALDRVLRQDEEDDHTRALADQATRMLDAAELQGLKPGRDEAKNTTKTVLGIVVLVALLGGGLFLVKNFLGGSGPAGSENVDYLDPEYGFGLTYPGPWLRVPGTGSNVINFNKMENNQQVAALRVYVDRSLAFETRGLTMGFEDYRAELKNRYGDSLVIRPPSADMIGDLPVLLYGFYNDTHQGKGVFLISGSTRYVLEASAPRQEYPAVSKTFTRLLQSFTLTAPDVIIDYPAPDDELIRLALGDEPRLRDMAEQERKFARNLVRRKDVRPENRYRAVQAFQRTLQMLAALNTPPPWAEEAGRELAAATKEFQDAVRETRFQITMAEKVNDAKTIYWESAKLMQMIPDKTDPVYQYAYLRNEYYKSVVNK